MSNEVDLIDKLATAYQPLTKVVSDLGSSLQKIERVVVRQETKLEDFTSQVSKMLDAHDKSIKALHEAKTTIFTSVKALWVFVPVAIGLAGFGIKQWASNFESRVKILETERKEAYEQFIKILGDKKNYLNQETIQNIFANL